MRQHRVVRVTWRLTSVCWIVVYIFTSPCPDRWHSAEDIPHTAFSRGKEEDRLLPLSNTVFLLPAPHQSVTVIIPFWSLPPPERTPASPEAVSSVCLTEWVESCKDDTRHVFKTHKPTLGLNLHAAAQHRLSSWFYKGKWKYQHCSKTEELSKNTHTVQMCRY